jgi:hypothetical protein
LVVRGEVGVGETALLEYLADRTSGCHIARAAGVQPEMELAFAGLHQLCVPMLGRVEHLPAPQRDALRTVFGMTALSAPDQFLVGLALLRTGRPSSRGVWRRPNWDMPTDRRLRENVYARGPKATPEVIGSCVDTDDIGCYTMR